MLVNACDDIKRHKEIMSALSQIIIEFSENLYKAKEAKMLLDLTMQNK